MKRAASIIALLFVTACASAPTRSFAAGPSGLRGCWTQQRSDQRVVQRWFPRALGGWQGDETTYLSAGAPDAVRWKLLRAEKGDAGPWRMCLVELNMASSPPCWPAQFKPRAARDEEDRWVEVAATPETLKITYVTGPDRLVTFEGRRTDCH